MKSLQVFAAQRNQLQGTIPSALLNSSTICILLLSDNRLRGRISHVSSSFKRPECIVTTDTATSSSFRPALLVHNNRLSCALPRHVSRGNARDPETDELVPECRRISGEGDGNFSKLKPPSQYFNSLLLPGNRFDGDAEDGNLSDWAYRSETGDPMATHAVSLLALGQRRRSSQLDTRVSICRAGSAWCRRAFRGMETPSQEQRRSSSSSSSSSTSPNQLS